VTVCDDRALVEKLVACRSRGRSTLVTVCAACPYVTEISAAPNVVSCRGLAPRPALPARVDVAEAAARTLAGDVVALEVRCVRDDARIEEVVRSFELGACCVPVVTASGRLVGVAHPASVLSSAGLAVAADVATPPSAVLFEWTPLSEAIDALARAPEGVLPVLSEGGGVFGILRGVDVARWLAARLGFCIDAE
jgi:CBS-domain-containing membrane protein